MTPHDSPSSAIPTWDAAEGAPAPLGPSWSNEHAGWNFALYSRNARSVTLLLYAPGNSSLPVYQRRLDRLVHKTGRVWHCRVRADEAPGAAHYGYRVEGEPGARDGHRFDPEKVLLDPYAPAVHFPPGYSREACKGAGPTDGRAPLGVLPRGERHPVRPQGRRVRHSHDTVVYELHVRGFTARSSSGVSPEKRGTFAGLVEKIPYLAELGVTVVELMPVHQYDPQEGNYWGYMTLHFFSPHLQYSRDGAFAEFREMVEAFHSAGIEVWLDVVYNHTSEGDLEGPDLLPARPRQQELLPARAGPRRLSRPDRLREHAAVRPSGRAAPHPGQPSFLGAGDARRRVPIRSRLHLHPTLRRRHRPGRSCPDRRDQQLRLLRGRPARRRGLGRR